MKLTRNQTLLRAGMGIVICLAWMASNRMGHAQAFSTTNVQGTVYLANGKAGSGVVQISWPAFATANNQAVAAGRTVVTIGSDGFLSVNLAANQGASPAGLYYTAVYHLSDGTTSTEYWVVPAAAQASLSQVRTQVMPAAQAVQAVTKTYVDQTISQLTQSLLTASGGTLSGPLFLNGDPAKPTQAATKHYVDTEFGNAIPKQGGVVTGPLTGVQLGAIYQADQFAGADFGAKVQACLNGLDATYGGTCDARNFSGNLTMSSNLTIATANATLELPCATIATASQIVIAPGTRNVTLHGCASRGASTASGSQGGTVLLYSGNSAMAQVGDPSYAVDTLGFHLDNVVINTTAASSGSAQALAAYRTQELDLESLYLLGNSNQTGMTLDGTGNYTGGTFKDDEFNGFGTAVNGIGHQVANAAATDWLNASTFVRVHINCPTSGGAPVSGTYGINLQQGDGNTFTGGDIEGCSTALHLGANAQNNTLVGVRNENSGLQIVADAGSSYNNWITGGTMFTGQLVDNGTRNSFLDTFHRSFNGLNGDWYGSQQDATVTNHYRVGIGSGNERGLLNRYQTDYGYRWTMGLSDATAGAQFYQVLDELNNVYRLSIGQYNHGQPSSNNQTVVNAAGTGAVVLNGSSNAGTGGVIFGAGGASGATVATINSAGNAQFNGTLQVGGPSTFTASTTVRNQTDAEIDAFLWAGATANQKESFIYKDYTGASQWYMVKDTSNNWALNSATGGLDSFKAYQSTNSGDTYINASNPSGIVRINYETGSGAGFNVYGGNSGSLYAGFTGPTSIKFPGLAAGSGHNCVQIDNTGYLSNTGAACSTVSSGILGQIAYYTANGTVVGGTSSVPLAAGGTGATNAAAALANLGAQVALGYTPANVATNLSDLTNKSAALNNLMAGTTVDGSGNVTHPGTLTVASAITAPAIAASSTVSSPQITISGAPSAQTDAVTVGYVQANASPGIVPQAASDGSASYGDDCEYINQQIQQAALGSGNNNPRVVHLYGKNYRCRKANYKILLPRDFGDYYSAGTSSGQGIAFALNIVNGSIQSCTVSGGSGYNANGYIIGQVKDPFYLGSGGSVYAVADTNGVPASCVVDSAGINYPISGVDVIPWAQGPDGATVTCSLVSGAFTSPCTSVSNGTGMPRGNGYTGSTFNSFVRPTGLNCTTYPTLSGTLGTSGASTSALTAVTTTAGTGCTYNASSTATVPFFVRDSITGGTAQATNVAPMAPVTIGCAIQLRNGVQIEGDGATIQTDWQTGNYTPNLMTVAFCDAYGNQAANITVRNVTLTAPAGFWFAGTTKNIVLDNITEQFASQKSNGSTYVPGSGGGVFMYAGNTGQGTVVNNISNYAPAGIVVGGQYVIRGGAGSGSTGGTNYVTNGAMGVNLASFGGVADGLKVTNFRQYRYTLYSGSMGTNMYNAGLDVFFEQYLWHSDLTSTTVANAPNGQGSCKSTLTSAIRATDSFVGIHCFRGVSDRAITIIPRLPYISQNLDLQNIWQDNSYRGPIIAAVTNSRFNVIQQAAVGSSYTDPYFVNSTPYLGLIETPGYSANPMNDYSIIVNPDTGATHFTNSLVATSTGTLGKNVISGSTFKLTTNLSNMGYAALTSGTATVTTPLACTASASCVYTLTNCGLTGTAGAAYVPANVVVGTSFAINSVSTTGSVVTTDTSRVCWRIN